MPTYPFKCDACGEEFDRILKIADRQLPEQDNCPKCNEMAVKRVVTSVPMGDSVRLGITRPPGDFKEVLQRINSRTAGAKLGEHSNLTRM